MFTKGIKSLLSKRVSDQYGSIRGFLRSKKYMFFYYLGRYEKYKKINWKDVRRLVFVCKGNICRSAFAEAVAKELAINTASFGLEAKDGSPANQQAICSARKKGFDLGQHKTTSLASFVMEPGDLIIAMEPSQIEFLEKNGRVDKPVTLLGIMGENVLPHIEDPFGKPPEYFDNCFGYLEREIKILGKRMGK